MRTEDLGERTRNCAQHGDFTSLGHRIMIGRHPRDLWTSCPHCKSMEATQGHLDNAKALAARETALLGDLLQQACIPKRFAGRSFDDYLAETPEQQRALRTCQAYADGFAGHLERGTGLVLSGKPGTGKSHLATAILKAILPQHVGVYLTMMDLVHLLRAGWGGGKAGEEAKTLHRLTELPLLVIDEIGVQFGSAAEQVHLFEVLDRRYRNMKPTILLTNLDRDGFRQCVGDRVADRLNETVSRIDFSWGSYRLEARKTYA